MCEDEARTDVGVDAASVPIEVELARQNPIVVIAASIEPGIGRIHEVGIVSVNEEEATGQKRVIIDNLYPTFIYLV